MAHPKVTRRVGGKLWHLEDSGLTKSDAQALRRHLTGTEDKAAKITKSKDGYKVWWSK